jgi:hypothetical protein
MPIERLEHACKVQQRPGQPVDLVNEHGVDLASLDVRQQALQGRSFHVAARETTVIESPWQARPALGCLTLDVRFGGLALGVQRVELLLQALFRRFAGIDGTAHDCLGGRFRIAITVHSSPLFALSLKNKKPLQ